MMLVLVNIGIAFLLDCTIGDPHGAPHPVCAIGRLVSALEKLLLRKRFQRFAGVVLLVSIAGVVFITAWYLSALSAVLALFLMYSVLATRSLAVEAMKVYRALQSDDINNARRQISYLVSRDTAAMNRSEICRAAVETVTENIVDGVTAPLFYLFIGGAPLAFLYKAVNTLDSMVGYKNDRYLYFGWASARCDDLLNFIPARITGFILIPAAALFTGDSVRGSLRVVLRDRLKHASPNSGHPEAAAAGALGVQMGGATAYFGVLHDKPVIGGSAREIEAYDIVRAVHLLYVTAVVALVTGGAISAGIHFLFTGRII